MGGIYEGKGTYVFLASDSWAKTWGENAQAEGKEKTLEEKPAQVLEWVGLLEIFGFFWWRPLPFSYANISKMFGAFTITSLP